MEPDVPRARKSARPTTTRRLRKATMAAMAAVFALSIPASASAAPKSGGGSGGKGSHSSSTLPSMALTSETIKLNPYAPPWCLAEDGYDQRTFYGSLDGTFGTSYQLCDPTVDYYGGIWWDAGGVGLESDVYVSGQATSLTITAPDGTSHQGVLMGQSTSKGVTTYHYAACYVPPYSLVSDTGGMPLQGGTWQVDVTGQVPSVQLTTNALMTDVPWQQAHCPLAEQNLVS